MLGATSSYSGDCRRDRPARMLLETFQMRKGFRRFCTQTRYARTHSESRLPTQPRCGAQLTMRGILAMRGSGTRRSSRRARGLGIQRYRVAASLKQRLVRSSRLAASSNFQCMVYPTHSARALMVHEVPLPVRGPSTTTTTDASLYVRWHGFTVSPDWFRLNATKWHGARQIGNAVPPPLARAIAAEVMKVLGATPIRPGLVLALGDTNLLKHDLSSASAYFGVERLPARRDRKSGARKRKQADIEAERLVAEALHG